MAVSTAADGFVDASGAGTDLPDGGVREAIGRRAETGGRICNRRRCRGRRHRSRRPPDGELSNAERRRARVVVVGKSRAPQVGEVRLRLALCLLF